MDEASNVRLRRLRDYGDTQTRLARTLAPAKHGRKPRDAPAAAPAIEVKTGVSPQSRNHVIKFVRKTSASGDKSAAAAPLALLQGHRYDSDGVGHILNI